MKQKPTIANYWDELAKDAPHVVTSGPFYDWTLQLARRVEQGEVTPIDALQAMKWLVVTRMAERYDARERGLLFHTSGTDGAKT